MTLHCDDLGGYEPLQCDDGRCWCADPSTGLPTTRAVIESLAFALPCNDNSDFNASNGRYRRRCESRKYDRAQTRRTLALHGFNWLDNGDVTCDANGGFAAVFCDREAGQCRCVDENGKLINNYFSQYLDKDTMNCRCARDELKKVTQLACDVGPKAGNYAEMQSFDNYEYCVDSDGFQLVPFYPIAQANEKPCRMNECLERRNFCQDVQLCRDCDVNCIV